MAATGDGERRAAAGGCVCRVSSRAQGFSAFRAAVVLVLVLVRVLARRVSCRAH